MEELISVPEAAEELHLDPSRVRALAGAGLLPAVKIGGRWAIERQALAQRGPGRPGRPFVPQNAWALLFLASGIEVDWLGQSVHWRMREALSRHRLEDLLPRLRLRAELRRYRVHPGELGYLLDSPSLVLSGANAARSHKLRLVSANEVDAYVRDRDLGGLEDEHSLAPAGLKSSNVAFRIVPDEAWQLDGQRYAPLAAVAVDLAEDPNPRARRSAEFAFRRLGQYSRVR